MYPCVFSPTAFWLGRICNGEIVCHLCFALSLPPCFVHFSPLLLYYHISRPIFLLHVCHLLPAPVSAPLCTGTFNIYVLVVLLSQLAPVGCKWGVHICLSITRKLLGKWVTADESHWHFSFVQTQRSLYIAFIHKYLQLWTVLMGLWNGHRIYKCTKS